LLDRLEGVKIPLRPMSTSPVANSTRRVRCPSCGSEKLQLRTERDHIDRLYQTASDRVKRLFVADMQLYHCRVCRLQFYDLPRADDPPAQEKPAGAPPDAVTTVETPVLIQTVIGETVSIRGRVMSQENILLEGEIEGDLECPSHRLTIGTAGRMRGDVLAAEVVGMGAMEGNIEASRSLALRASAKMTGDIRTPSLSIEEGALFTGKIDHT